MESILKLLLSKKKNLEKNMSTELAVSEAALMQRECMGGSGRASFPELQMFLHQVSGKMVHLAFRSLESVWAFCFEKNRERERKKKNSYLCVSLRERDRE